MPSRISNAQFRVREIKARALRHEKTVIERSIRKLEKRIETIDQFTSRFPEPTEWYKGVPLIVFEFGRTDVECANDTFTTRKAEFYAQYGDESSGVWGLYLRWPGKVGAAQEWKGCDFTKDFVEKAAREWVATGTDLTRIEQGS